MKNTFKLQDNTTMNDLASFDEIMEYLRKKHRTVKNQENTNALIKMKNYVMLLIIAMKMTLM